MAAVSAFLAGATFGVTHALEADHVAAVATILSEEERSPAAVGAFWGVGHTAPIAVVGLAFVALGSGFPIPCWGPSRRWSGSCWSPSAPACWHARPGRASPSNATATTGTGTTAATPTSGSAACRSAAATVTPPAGRWQSASFTASPAAARSRSRWSRPPRRWVRRWPTSSASGRSRRRRWPASARPAVAVSDRRRRRRRVTVRLPWSSGRARAEPAGPPDRDGTGRPVPIGPGRTTRVGLRASHVETTYSSTISTYSG